MNETENTTVLFEELKQLIDSELGELAPKEGLKRAFQPITNGLGIQSPRKIDTFFENNQKQSEHKNPDRAIPPVFPTPKASGSVSRGTTLDKLMSTPFSTNKSAPPSPTKKVTMTEALGGAESTKKSIARASQVPLITEEIENIPQAENLPPSLGEGVVPPPLPKATFLRRLLAGMLDILFVGSLWAFALGMTLKFLTGSFLGLSASEASFLQDPQFLRFAAAEFFTLWLAYFALSVGLLDMTFGMWIWGLKVGYLKNSTQPPLARKTLRIVVSFLFYATLVPLLLLAIGRRGRNLLDLISGTQLYRCTA